MHKEARISIAVALVSLFCLTGVAGADMNVNVNIGVPPLVIAAPPALVVIPGTYVYFAPDVGVDLIFYQGYWYRPHAGHWYRSHAYNGGWVVVNVVPAPILHLPPRWKQAPPGHARMPYREVQDNWQVWERERHWEKQDGKHRERSDDDRGKKDKGKKQGKKGRHRDD